MMYLLAILQLSVHSCSIVSQILKQTHQVGSSHMFHLSHCHLWLSPQAFSSWTPLSSCCSWNVFQLADKKHVRIHWCPMFTLHKIHILSLYKSLRPCFIVFVLWSFSCALLLKIHFKSGHTDLPVQSFLAENAVFFLIAWKKNSTLYDKIIYYHGKKIHLHVYIN